MKLAIFNSSSSVNKILASLFLVYLVFFFILLPLMSPLRNLGIIDPGLIRNLFLPPLFILIFFSVGVSNILKPKTAIQFFLIFIFFYSLIIGTGNLIEGNSFRSYLSHLFQIATAYTMVCVGWIMFEYWGERFWKRFIQISLVVAFISTAVTINALSKGDIGRYYTAAYGFILISSYAIVFSKKTSLISFVGVLISNKRAVLLAIVSMHLFSILKVFNNIKGMRKKRKIINGFLTAFFLAISFLSVIFILPNWSSVNESNPLAKAVNISINRVEQVVNFSQSNKTLDEISSGRFQEINAVIHEMKDYEYLIGKGAGWEMTLELGKKVQNIHFTPLSIVVLYGLPFTLVFYSLLLYCFVKAAFLSKKYSLTVTEKIAPLYFTGAMIHSFFAYSLFIDWMFFFFIGVMSRTIANKRKRIGLNNA